MKKNKIFIRIIFITLLLCILGTGTYLGLLSYAFRWSDWEALTEISTDDGLRTVILFASYPPLPPNYNIRIKVVCRDNVLKKECEYKVCGFSVPDDNDVIWFELKEVDENKAKFILNHSYGQETITLVWQDIFS